MRKSVLHLNATDAARKLGISAKALRLYERHALLTPPRTAAGWRLYGPVEMARAKEIVALRQLGLGLAQIKGALLHGEDVLGKTLAAHQAGLERQIEHIARTVRSIETARTDLALKTGTVDERRTVEPVVLELPWPWGGERFYLPAGCPITYITGPLGSGKTRLARAIANAVPNAAFVGLERLADDGAALLAAMAADAALRRRSERHLLRLSEQGAAPSPALTALILAVEISEAAALVIDMVEQGLDQATQQVLRHYLRSEPFGARSLFLLTRSSAMLDLSDVSTEENILYCPANHDVPMIVAPRRGARGYEAVATCLATPAVRARTEGVIAWRPGAA